MKVIKLLSDWMLLRLDPPKEATSGGIIRVTAQPIWTGVVTMAGPGRRYTDKFVPMEPGIVGARVAFLSAAADGHKTGLSWRPYLEDNQRFVRLGDVLFAIEGKVDMELSKSSPYYGAQ